MLLRDDLLSPIAGPNPAGPYLAFDSVDDTYARIQEARREEVVGSHDAPGKTPDHALVIKLAGEALASRSKDLQLAAWLAEALVRRDGVAGLRAALELLVALVERYWETLHPEPEGGELELRTAPLGLVATLLPRALHLAPLTSAGHPYFRYAESRDVGYEADAKGDDARMRRRQQQLADGRLAPEELDSAIAATPKAFYRQLTIDLAAASRALATLESRVAELAGDAAPNFGPLHDAIAAAMRTAEALLQQKLALDPDPLPEPEAAPAALARGDAQVPADDVPAGAPLPALGRGDDAAAHIVAAAHALRRARPQEPAAYLVLRALRWGELRAGAPTALAPTLLEAPPTRARVHLRSLLLAERWAELLDAGEEVMGTPSGRGWLDLQRYVLAACAGLGSEYDAVAAAVRGALRQLLAELPAVAQATLMDDLPAANAETLAWLAAQGMLAPVGANGAANGAGQGPGGGAANGAHGAATAPMTVDDEAGARTTARAAAALRAGDPARAVAVHTEALARVRSPRGRYLRRTEIAATLVDGGLPAVALPILRELLEMVEAHKLEAWEPAEVVARPMVLLCRCLDALGTEGETRQALYVRACRLDPLQALSIPAPAAPGTP